MRSRPACPTSRRTVDGIVCTGGAARLKPWDQLTDEDWTFSLANKLLGQVNVVRYGLKSVRAGGAITLTTGLASQCPAPGSAIITTVNSAVDAFVRAVAAEPSISVRVKAVSPGLVAETLQSDGTRSGREAFLPLKWPRSPSDNFARARQVRWFRRRRPKDRRPSGAPRAASASEAARKGANDRQISIWKVVSARRQSTISTLSNRVRVAKPTGKDPRPRSSGQPALRTRAAVGPLAMRPIWRWETSTRLCAVPSSTDSSVAPNRRGVGAVRDQEPFVRAEPQSRAPCALDPPSPVAKAIRRRTPCRRKRAPPRFRAK